MTVPTEVTCLFIQQLSLVLPAFKEHSFGCFENHCYHVRARLQNQNGTKVLVGINCYWNLESIPRGIPGSFNPLARNWPESRSCSRSNIRKTYTSKGGIWLGQEVSAAQQCRRTWVFCYLCLGFWDHWHKEAFSYMFCYMQSCIQLPVSSAFSISIQWYHGGPQSTLRHSGEPLSPCQKCELVSVSCIGITSCL